MLGKLLQGRYQVVQVLGAGGFCQTYLAQDRRQPGHPTCVVKHLKPVSNQPNSLPTLRQLFTTEAQALKQLGDHDQIPQLYAHFEDNLEFYLVQEFIPGHPLSEELLSGHRWSESQVIQLLQEVLGILELVHSHKLIHRDIKPSNLIRREQDGRLVLVDFGSVKQVWTQVVTAQGQTSTTFAQGIPATIAIGTPGYMPTEQGRGRPRPNSDIYALGMIGIQALTGLNPTQLLEDSDTGELIWQHHAQTSLALTCVLNNMVRYHFKDRYQSAQEALQALQPLANLHPLPSRAGGRRGQGDKGDRSGDKGDRSGESSSTKKTRGRGEGETRRATHLPASCPSANGDLRFESPRHTSSSEPPVGGGWNTRTTGFPASERPRVPASLSSILPPSPHPPIPPSSSPALGHSKAFPNKSTLLIGLGIGIVSTLAITVGIYYSLRPPAPAPPVQKYPVSTQSYLNYFH